MEHDVDDGSPGWNAIDAAMQPLYPDQEPLHYGNVISARLGGPNPLDGTSVWKRFAPVPHWHFLTYGLSELYAKESEDAEISGYGFELTFRLRCEPDAEEPPAWALNFLQNLARYVFQSGNVFRDGDWMAINGPIASEEDTLLCYIALTADPELPAIDTPNGRMEFLQVIGLTDDEAYAGRQWKVLKLLEALKPGMPLWITDLARPSLLDLDGVPERIAQGLREDGSATGSIFTDQLTWRQEKRLLRADQIIIEIGARQVSELTVLLPLRLPFDRSFRVLGPNMSVLFTLGQKNAVSVEDNQLHVELEAATVTEIAALLQPRRGSYDVQSYKGLRFDVLPTMIKDRNGEVTETIG